MLWIFYNILFGVGFVCMLPYYLFRMRRRGGYARNFWQRLGRYHPSTLRKLQSERRIWVHAVSVGETYIALRLIEELRSRGAAFAFVMTVTTSTAHGIAEEALHEADVLLYFPVDFPPVTRRVLHLIDPVALILMEGELWPNLIRLARARGTRVAVVNGRLSSRSYAGYRRVRLFVSRVLPMIDRFCVQSDTDAKRLVSLGAPPDQVQVLGSAKYDVAVRETDGTGDVREMLRAAGIEDTALVLLGGSTWEGEETALLETYAALREKHRDLALVLVPRHAERKERVIAEIQAHGFEAVCRSTLHPSAPRRGTDTPGVLLVDTTGELRRWYACADVIFVGKSLTQRGGQNILEPAVYGKPVLVGPHMQNFPVVMADLLEANAVIQVTTPASLSARVDELLADEGMRVAYGERAAALVEAKRGVIARTASEILALLGSVTHED